MSEPIEGLYFNWLCAKVLDVKVSNYHDLMRILYSTEFIWVVPGDENRAADGIELREYFLRETRYENDPNWFNSPCSVFEVLLSFAQRASFQTDEPTRKWFWEFLFNLKLDDYRRVSKSDIPIIEDILNNFIWRTYEPNGDGGLFPIQSPKHDQRKVEIWYQFCEYVEEKGLF